MDIPKDATMLLSFINLKLRDFYASLSLLCEDMDLNEQEIKDKLAMIDYYYDSDMNRFV